MERKPLISILILLQAIFNDVHLIIAQKPTPTQQSFNCRNNGNFKSDALLKERDDAFDILYRKMGERYIGYETGGSHGINGGVWSMALCPFNIKMEACRECLNNTIPYLKKNCPKQKEGVAWTTLLKVTCTVRYADSPIAGRYDPWAWIVFSSIPNQTPGNAGDLEKGLNNLVNKLKGTAAGGDHLKKFAFGTAAYAPSSRSLYGSMQCTPDIGNEECMKCLSDATNRIHNCCSKERKFAGVVWSTNCYFRYAHFDFSS